MTKKKKKKKKICNYNITDYFSIYEIKNLVLSLCSTVLFYFSRCLTHFLKGWKNLAFSQILLLQRLMLQMILFLKFKRTYGLNIFVIMFCNNIFFQGDLIQIWKSVMSSSLFISQWIHIIMVSSFWDMFIFWQAKFLVGKIQKLCNIVRSRVSFKAARIGKRYFTRKNSPKS